MEARGVYTQEAGRCLIMRIKAAGKNATLVLLNAGASSTRAFDALSIRRLMGGEEPRMARASSRGEGRTVKASLRSRIAKHLKPRHRRA